MSDVLIKNLADGLPANGIGIIEHRVRILRFCNTL